jgi:hypothetical protein
MPWQIQRWRNSPRVLAMSLAGQGGFRNFLDVGWQHGGRVPNHPGAFQGFAMCKSAREWKRIEKEVLQMFKVSSDGKWLLNDTLTKQWKMSSKKMAAMFETRSLAGSKGAAKRWHADSKPIANQSQADSKPMANDSTLPNHTLSNQTLPDQTSPDQTLPETTRTQSPGTAKPLRADARFRCDSVAIPRDSGDSPALSQELHPLQTLADQTPEPETTARSGVPGPPGFGGLGWGVPQKRPPGFGGWSSRDELFAKAYAAYPRQAGRRAAEEAWSSGVRREAARRAASYAEVSDWIYQRVMTYAAVCAKHNKPRELIPHMAKWLKEDRFLDDPGEWAVHGGKTNGAGNYKTASAGLQFRNVQALVLDGMGAGVSRSHVPDGRAVQPGAPGGDRGAPGALAHHALLEGEPAAVKPGADA